MKWKYFADMFIRGRVVAFDDPVPIDGVRFSATQLGHNPLCLRIGLPITHFAYDVLVGAHPELCPDDLRDLHREEDEQLETWLKGRPHLSPVAHNAGMFGGPKK